MTHRYEQPILVRLAGDGSPALLRWRAAEYRVRAVLARWDLRDRWWATEGTASAETATASDRHYYRLDCDPGLVCDVYYDAAVGHWVLELVYD